MKNAYFSKIQVSIGMVLTVLVLGATMVALPAPAQADYIYGNYSPYACQSPYMAHTGYYFCPTTPNYPAPQPYPVPVPVPQYPQLSVSCSVQSSSVLAGNPVQWVASVYGGTGSYSYSWSGTDNLFGSSQFVTKTYFSYGVKSASVTVYSGNQTASAYCANTVTVHPQQTISYYPPVPQYIQPPVYSGNNAGLDVGCYADPVTASLNQPVTWNVEVSGGIGPYTYSWSGSDGLSGNQSSVIKYYSTSGEKSAIVSVTSADGKTGTRACSNTLTIRAAARPATTPASVAPAPVQDDKDTTGLTAASFFSLNNVPWGWVAILVIIVLLGTIIYMIANRTKM